MDANLLEGEPQLHSDRTALIRVQSGTVRQLGVQQHALLVGHVLHHGPLALAQQLRHGAQRPAGPDRAVPA